MFQNNSKLAATILTLGLSSGLPGCDYTYPKTEPVPVVPSSNVDTLGFVGDISIYLKEIAGSYFIVADGYDSNGIIHHEVQNSNWTAGQKHTFSITRVEGTLGDNTLYQIELDGLKYILVDGYDCVSIARSN